MRTSKIGGLALLLLNLAACSESKSGGDGMNAPEPSASDSAFSSVEVAASASEAFTTPLSGVPLASGGIAFIAMQPGTDETPARPALFRASPGEAPSVLYSGDLLRTPLDLDVSADGTSILVADS